jgi:uncharacterized protein (TIGR03437 family)
MDPLGKVIPIILLASLLSHAQITANGGNDRTNANLQETQLTPASVSASTFGKFGTFSVDGQVYAQPLYVGGLAIPGKGTHNVLFVATMHNSIYAFDADSATSPVILWQATLGAPVPAPMLFGQYGDIAVEVGILGTPVIDRQRNVIYAVTDILQGGAPAFFIHALDLATGAERLNGPVAIKGSVPGTGSAASGGTVAFDPKQHIQRPALLLANGAVYAAFGSHGDDSPYHGWLISYDASNLARQMGVYMSTPNGDGGSFWQSGRGPAADEQGNIYTLTGNGDFDGVQNFGQSILKLSGAAPSLAGSYTPVNWKAMSDNDADLAAGPALISGTHRMVAADKAGNLYLLDGDAMGKPGADSSAFQVFPISEGSIFNFAVWGRPGNSYLYVQARNEPLKCFQVTPSGFNSVPVSMSATPVRWVRTGMTLSADGTQLGTGILWQITGNYNDATVPATLHAYDASNLAVELWNSDMNGERDTMGPTVKFVGPTVADGKVFAPDLSNEVIVYGLHPPVQQHPGQPVIGAVASAASYSGAAVAPGEIVAVFGANLGPANPAGMELDATGSVATIIAGTQVLFDGVPGPMVFASTGQVNAIAPFTLSSQTAQVQVQYQGSVSGSFTMPVAPAVPAVFSLDGSGAGQGIILNQDGSVNSADRPAPAGSVIVLYATGAGQTSPPGRDGAVVTVDDLPVPVLPVAVFIGGQRAKVLYAGGAPGTVEGVIQVNVEIPVDVSVGPAVSLVLRVGAAGSQPGITVAVK